MASSSRGIVGKLVGQAMEVVAGAAKDRGWIGGIEAVMVSNIQG